VGCEGAEGGERGRRPQAGGSHAWGPVDPVAVSKLTVSVPVTVTTSGPMTVSVPVTVTVFGPATVFGYSAWTAGALLEDFSWGVGMQLREWGSAF